MEAWASTITSTPVMSALSPAITMRSWVSPSPARKEAKACSQRYGTISTTWPCACARSWIRWVVGSRVVCRVAMTPTRPPARPDAHGFVGHGFVDANDRDIYELPGGFDSRAD